jgi:hypothetical protein
MSCRWATTSRTMPRSSGESLPRLQDILLRGLLHGAGRYPHADAPPPCLPPCLRSDDGGEDLTPAHPTAASPRPSPRSPGGLPSRHRTTGRFGHASRRLRDADALKDHVVRARACVRALSHNGSRSPRTPSPYSSGPCSHTTPPHSSPSPPPVSPQHNHGRWRSGASPCWSYSSRSCGARWSRTEPTTPSSSRATASRPSGPTWRASTTTCTGSRRTSPRYLDNPRPRRLSDARDPLSLPSPVLVPLSQLTSHLSPLTFLLSRLAPPPTTHRSHHPHHLGHALPPPGQHPRRAFPRALG